MYILKKIGKLSKMSFYCWRTILKGYARFGFRPYYLKSLLECTEIVYNPNHLFHMSFGSLNKGKTIAIIRLDRKWVPTAGFFALLLKTLCGLYYASNNGFEPVIFAWEGSTYQEKEMINGTQNVFEYYFKPVSEIKIEDALNSYSVIDISEYNENIAFSENDSQWFDMKDEFIELMGRIYRKYILLNDYISNGMNEQIRDLLSGKKSLGIHFRGSDYKLNTNGHPVSLEVEDYYEYIDEAIDKFQFTQIFIATDDKRALNKFAERYKNVVFYSDVERTDGDVSVAFLENKREKHHFLLGYEVLRDAYTLASCSGFIGGQSQVSVNVRIHKASKEEKFDYCKILKKGINRNSLDWMKYYYTNLSKCDES